MTNARRVRGFVRGSALLWAAGITAMVAACGTTQTVAQVTTKTATTHAPTTKTTANNGVPPRPAPTKKSKGRGRLLAPVLLYRLLADDPESSSYDAFFRTEGAFPRKFSDNTLIPGQIWIGDSWDNHDGFVPLGAGRPRGRCYEWGVTRTPQLDRNAIGAPIRITLRLKRTTGVQQRSVRLRDGSAGYFTRRFRQQLAQIGCTLRPTVP